MLDFERSDRFTARQKAALAYTSMLVWTPDAVDDSLWDRLHEHFDDAEIVELGSFVCVTFGQQRVIKTWAVGHGEFLADTTGGLKAGSIGGEAADARPKTRPSSPAGEA